MVPVPSVPAQRLLPHSLRMPSGLVACAALLILGTLGWRYAGEGYPRWLDTHIQAAVEPLGLGVPWNLVLDLGDPIGAATVILVLAGTSLVFSGRRLALLAIAGPVLTGVVTTALKPLVGRLHTGSLAYPSGHAALATAFGLVIALLVVSLLRPARPCAGLLLLVGAVAAGGTMALALVVERWHYPTDTLGGCATAVAVVLGSALLIDHLAERRVRARTA